MSAQHLSYRERAAEARAGAASATLANVRDRWLASEAAWMAMADRSERADKARDELVAQKASERAALKAEQDEAERDEAERAETAE